MYMYVDGALIAPDDGDDELMILMNHTFGRNTARIGCDDFQIFSIDRLSSDFSQKIASSISFDFFSIINLSVYFLV